MQKKPEVAPLSNRLAQFKRLLSHLALRQVNCMAVSAEPKPQAACLGAIYLMLLVPLASLLGLTPCPPGPKSR
ncbi:hypothetical protein NBRC116598_15870 [Pseudophaeobacter arcticus]|uniref:Uncharacterized protein n=1 Tax=Pseudophaeobacter arcticus TaxID=385492 RepID=A0ABQ0AJX3_9RHOB